MTHTHGPAYEFRTCLDCRLAFVRSARPSRPHQDSNIAYLERYHGFSQAETIAELKKS